MFVETPGSEPPQAEQQPTGPTAVETSDQQGSTSNGQDVQTAAVADENDKRPTINGLSEEQQVVLIR